MWQCYLADTRTGERLMVLPNNKAITIGRNCPFIDIEDVRCSRAHAQLTFLRDSQSVRLEAKGNNPLVVFASGSKNRLNKGQHTTVTHSQTFSLVPTADSLTYRIDIEGPPSSTTTTSPTPTHAPSTPTTTTTTTTTSSLNSSSKKRPREEGPSVKLNEDISPAPAQPHSKKPKIDAAPVNAAVPPLQPTQKILKPCKYGAGCYNKNPKHQAQFSHPPLNPTPTSVSTPSPTVSASDGPDMDTTIEDEDDEATQESSSLTLLGEKISASNQIKTDFPKVKDTTAAKPTVEIPWNTPPKQKAQKPGVSSVASTTAPSVQAAKQKKACKYGANCYNKCAAHMNAFSHPTAGSSGTGNGSGDIDMDTTIEESDKDEPEEEEEEKLDNMLKAKSKAKKAVASTKPKEKSKKAKKTTTTHQADSNPLSGRKVVLTGSISLGTRKQLNERLANLGANIMAAVSKNVDIVIAGSGAGSKLDKAREHGCEIWDEEKLGALLLRLENQSEPESEPESRKGKEKKSSSEDEKEEEEEEEEGENDSDHDDDDEDAALDKDLPKALHKMKAGDSVEVPGSGSTTYTIKRCTGGVYSCRCPAWCNQNMAVDSRTCKHLRAYLGDAYETARVGREATVPVAKTVKGKVAPPLLLAHSFEKKNVDPTGWWISEKLDGVRAYWDGKTFISRLGNPYMAGSWFTADFPTDQPLDGELFGGRKQFNKTVSIVKSQGDDKRWKTLQFHVFDAPKLDLPFEKRMEWIKAYLAKHPSPYIKLVEQTKCTGMKDVKTKLAAVEALGGEGLMLRQPGSKYVDGRSGTLLKVKSFYDAEARVTGYTKGEGKHKGRVGALLCVMANGNTFKVGTGLSDRVRENPPDIGSIITYSFQELTPDGVPRFPVFVGERADMTEPKDPDLSSASKTKKKKKK
eukprot:TRINITY_DN1363_c1_g1_i1.p1 TRINITY_DN1363_c1_g1~~TRINITY_DN1363_c1_g1_i1.p1  ORF type:complete len:911 (+),score=182.49 TRINITY_DN1363_c1_g1_i1:15-2747(+)